MTELERLRKLAAAASAKREAEMKEAIEIAELKQQISVANNAELTALIAASTLATANLKKISDIRAIVVDTITSTTNAKGEKMRVVDSHNYEFKDSLLREVLSLAVSSIYTSPLIKGQIETIIKPLTFLELGQLVESAGRLPYFSEKNFTLVGGTKADISQLETVLKTILAKLDIEASSSFITASEYDELYNAAQEKAEAQEKAFKKQQALAALIKEI